jgi:hypothetical protein
VVNISPSHRLRRGLLLGTAAALVAAAVVVGTTMARASTLFSDDFEQPTGNVWLTGGGGSWSVVSEDGSHVFRQSNTSVDTAAWAGSGSGAFTSVTASVKPNTGSGTVALLSKVANPNNFYYVGLRAGQLEVGRRSFGTTSSLASTPFTANTGTWYQLTLNLFFSGQIRGSVTPVAGGTGASVSAADPGGTGFGTAVGFWTVNASASFDNITLSDDRITPPTTTPAPSCPVTITYTVTVQFTGGFVANISLRNNTGTQIPAGWVVTFSFTNGERITNMFNVASWHQVGPAVTFTGPVWGPIVANASFTAPGFTAVSTVAPAPIVGKTFNGTPC